MSEGTENNVAAPVPPPGSNGNGKQAAKVLTSGQKNLSGTWHRVGKLERIGEGIRITFTVFSTEHTVYLTRREVLKITADRMPGEICTITETAGEIITCNVGKAFRSRTGRALMIRTPNYSGDLMTPWQAFQKVMDGSQMAAPVSIIEQGNAPPQRHSEPPASTTAARGEIRAGLQGCF